MKRSKRSKSKATQMHTTERWEGMHTTERMAATVSTDVEVGDAATHGGSPLCYATVT